MTLFLGYVWIDIFCHKNSRNQIWQESKPRRATLASLGLHLVSLFFTREKDRPYVFNVRLASPISDLRDFFPCPDPSMIFACLFQMTRVQSPVSGIECRYHLSKSAHTLTGIFSHSQNTSISGGTFSVVHQTLESDPSVRKSVVCSIPSVLLHTTHFVWLIEAHRVSSVHPDGYVILVVGHKWCVKTDSQKGVLDLPESPLFPWFLRRIFVLLWDRKTRCVSFIARSFHAPPRFQLLILMFLWDRNTRCVSFLAKSSLTFHAPLDFNSLSQVWSLIYFS